MRFARVPIIAAALTGGASLALAGTDAAPETDATPEAPVTVRLVTDASAIAPGSPFFLGVEIETRAGWHVYWKNPGDAGLSTDLAFEVPEGFEVGPVRYPVPETFVQPGDITGYGYSRPVVLFAEITAPTTLAPGDEVPIGVTADWLSCKHVCIPGHVTLETRLPVAETAVRSLKSEAWTAALPAGLEGYRPFIDRISATKTSPTAAAYELTLEWLAIAPRELEWIPDTPAELRITNTTIRRLGQTTRVSFEASLLDGASLDVEKMETVVAYDGAGGERLGVVLPVGLKMFAGRPN